VLSDMADARQWVAFSGLDPCVFTSGTSVEKRPRISRGGSRHLRRAPYMPALVALRREPHLRRFYERLLSHGKARLQAVVAVMRNSCTPCSRCFVRISPMTDPSSVASSPLLTTKWLEHRQNWWIARAQSSCSQNGAWPTLGLRSSSAVSKKREVLRDLSREKTVPDLSRKKNLIFKRESIINMLGSFLSESWSVCAAKFTRLAEEPTLLSNR
jgi:hypothetical protein